jgi:hypothetical protein
MTDHRVTAFYIALTVFVVMVVVTPPSKPQGGPIPPPAMQPAPGAPTEQPCVAAVPVVATGATPSPPTTPMVGICIVGGVRTLQVTSFLHGV